MIVRFDKQALIENQNNKDKAIGVEGDSLTAPGKISEAEKILSTTMAKIAESGTSAVGISASNSGRGHEPAPVEDGENKGFTPTVIEGPVEEEPGQIEDSPEVTPLSLSTEDPMQVDTPRETTTEAATETITETAVPKTT